MTTLPSYTVSEFAALKKCSRNTIYLNREAFTWIKVPGAKVDKILFNDKAQEWEPNPNMKRNKKKRRS